MKRLLEFVALVALVGVTTFVCFATTPADVVAQVNNQNTGVKPERVAKLPRGVDSLVIAKNGDLIVVKFTGKKLLGVVDVKLRKLTKTIRITSTEVLLAAGGDRALVYDVPNSIFTSYSLTEFSRVKSKKSPYSGSVSSIHMGSANPEFALVKTEKGMQRLNLKTLTNSDKFKPFADHNITGYSGINFNLNPKANFFGAMRHGVSPSGQIVGSVSDTGMTLKYEHNSVGNIIPVPGKQIAVTSGGSVISAANRVVKQHRGLSLYPDHTGIFYLGVGHNNRRGGDSEVAVFATGTHEKFTSIKLPITVDRWGRSGGSVYPLSQHKVLAMISPNGMAINFFKFDPIGELEDSDLDYLIVLSSPPDQVKRGTKFSYKPEVKTNAKKWVIELMDAPEGAKVVNENTVEWDVPKDYDEEKVDFLLRIETPNEDELFHDFELNISEAE